MAGASIEAQDVILGFFIALSVIGSYINSIQP